jgi:hypothetical protein
METFTIQGVEIFSVGTWNGDPYTIDDLEGIVQAFNDTKDGVRPFMKLGHPNKQKILQEAGLPAAGWIGKLYVQGEKLIADLTDIPKQIYELIHSKGYRKVSCEIYQNIAIKEKKYKNLLGAVALLGAEMPGVMNLKDIMGQYFMVQGIEPKFYSESIEEIKTIEFETNHGKETAMPKTETEVKLEIELKQKSDELAANVAKFSQAEADAKVLADENASLKKFKADAEARELELKVEAEKAKISKFATELQAEKLCTPAMKPLVEALLGPDMKEYSFQNDGKESKMSKEDLLKETLKLFSAASKVNFEQSSVVGVSTDKNSEKEIDEKAKAYAAEKKVSYSTALKFVMAESNKA